MRIALLNAVMRRLGLLSFLCLAVDTYLTPVILMASGGFIRLAERCECMAHVSKAPSDLIRMHGACK